MKRIGCVIVTFNKVHLLKECLGAVLLQTRPLDEIILIDNYSTDGTEDYVQGIMNEYTGVHYVKLAKNIGGAGGFNAGLKKARDFNLDYIWIMDDDTIPNHDALERLIKDADAKDLNWGFLCSNVRWTDEQPCLMNIPTVEDDWTAHSDLHLIKVKSASFVSLLVKNQVIEEVGFPIKDFFIWGDDVEYTERITKQYSGYLVLDSKVIHKMGANQTTDIIKEDAARINRYFYDYRNRLFIAKRKGFKAVIKYFIATLMTMVRIAVSKESNKPKKIAVILRGATKGVFFNPKIEVTD